MIFLISYSKTKHLGPYYDSTVLVKRQYFFSFKNYMFPFLHFHIVLPFRILTQVGWNIKLKKMGEKHMHVFYKSVFILSNNLIEIEV